MAKKLEITLEKIWERILAAFQKYSEGTTMETLKSRIGLEDMGFDSSDRIELEMAIEDEFDLLPDNEFDSGSFGPNHSGEDVHKMVKDKLVNMGYKFVE